MWPAPALLALLACISVAATAAGGEPLIDISTDFPGGNVTVVANDGSLVQLAPDLRGGRDWFYWCFEATALRGGEVTFQFPERVAGFRQGAVGFQGPAVSLDRGRTWNWRGASEERTSAREFRWKFDRPDQTVRLAVTIPYLESDFQAFAKTHKGNPHFHLEQLATTRGGRGVELVRIGEPGEGRRAVLMTCRHHACETIASFLLEGLLVEAMSDSATGRAFRDEWVLYAVPFVDKDGVQEGDQGKNRRPHDHNRDYGPDSIYPSVQAIKRLGVEKRVEALLDLHCPTLVMDIHQRFYFAGPNDLPSDNAALVTRFANLIKDELPEGAPYGPAIQLSATTGDRHKHCSGYFAKLDGMLMSATLETPFAPPKTDMSPDAVRSYGAAVLRAWNRLRLGASEP